MAFQYVYEQDYLFSGWPDEGGGGLTLLSWFDRDLANDHVIPLYELEPSRFISDNDSFYVTLPITTETFPGFFIEKDIFYAPVGVRALRQPVQMIRNEIRRVR